MINQISIKKLAEFRRYSDDQRKNFVNKLKIPKEPKTDNNGGNYWARSLSAISSAFKNNDNTCIREKIDKVTPLYEASGNKKIKQQYERNLKILHDFEDFNFANLYPDDKLMFLKKSSLLLTIKDLPMKVQPNHVFAYGSKEEPTVGGIWFVVWSKVFNAGDLGIFSEALYTYLVEVYKDKYKVDPNYCLIMDAQGMQTITFNEVLEGKVPALFRNTIDTLVKYL